jgi:hypothetical protein
LEVSGEISGEHGTLPHRNNIGCAGDGRGKRRIRRIGAGIRTPGGSGYREKNRGIGGEVIGESCRVVDIVFVIPEDEILDQDPGAKLMVKLGVAVRVWDECLLHGC